MCRYVCLSFCSNNKARICANNRNEWLSEGEPQGSISCRHSAVCFHFPSVSLWSSLFLWLLLSPLCHSSDWKPGLGMNASTLAFSCFAPAPTNPPGGPPWSVSHSYLTRESSQEKTWLSDPQSPSLFLPNSKNMCAPWVHLWKENRLFPVFAQNAVPKTYCSQSGVVSMDVSVIWGCFAVMSHEETRQDACWWTKWIQAPWIKVSVASLGFLLGDLRDNSVIHPTHPPPSISSISEFISESFI